MEEIIFFTGKGGVGKTTLSLISAFKRAKEGKKVLLISIDPAHSLSDVMNEAKVVAPNNMDILEIDILKETQKYIRSALENIRKFIGSETFEKVRKTVESVAESPGTEDAVLIDFLSRLVVEKADKYSSLIIDTAPSGHTLRFLRDISSAGSLLEFISKEARNIEHLKNLSGTLKGNIEISNILRERYERIRKLDITIKKGNAYFFVVMNPDYVSLMETKRLIESLEKINLKIGAVIINKIMPSHIPEEYRGDQEEIIRRAEREFGRFKIIKVPFIRDMGFLFEKVNI